jgi:3-oxoacyl-[acyl-carrier-protein] synthase-3
MSGVRLLSVGSALPPKVVSNAMLAEELETSDEWIVGRTGIRERRVGGTTTDLAILAAVAALETATVDPLTINLLILATTTPDQIMPATAAAVARVLGVTGGLFDVDATCAGFVYGLIAGARMASRDDVQRVLVIGADTMTSLVDPHDRSTAVLFGDGAGAVLLETTDSAGDLLATDFGSDPTASHLLYAEHGGSIVMEGQEVFRRAVRSAASSVSKVLDRAHISPGDVDLFIPHQANARLIETLAHQVGIPLERTAIGLERTGNTSAASIPLALDEAVRAGRLVSGDIVVVCGFGAGMTWASAVLRWSGAER